MASPKIAVHFGAGNIGRGFIAQLMHKSGYEIIFIDVIDKTIDDLKKLPKYSVTAVSEQGEETSEITNYTAINSKYDMAAVVDKIVAAEVVTCAVGPNILKFIAEPVAKAICKRTPHSPGSTDSFPLAVIACENAVGATDTWRQHIEAYIKDKLNESKVLENMSTRARFANSAIDRIVPAQAPNSGLDVRMEKFFEWCVEQGPFEGAIKPGVDGIHYVDNLEPYIKRKLYTVNTGHATAAYSGIRRGKLLIHQAMQDEAVVAMVKSCLKETASLIVAKWGIGAAAQDDYVNKVIKRFSNPALEDRVERVGRAPMRKLSRNERFIGPAALLAELNMNVDGLLAGVKVALQFQNIKDDQGVGDQESIELAKILKENNAEAATERITGLAKTHPLFDRVKNVVAEVQG